MPNDGKAYEPESDQAELDEALHADSEVDGDDVDTDDATEDLDEQHLVLKRLLLAHEAWFNVERDYEFAGRVFPGYAEFQSYGEGYVLTKKAKLWGVNAFEYMFFHLSDTLDSDELAELVEFVTVKGLEKVNPGPEHMTSYLTLVVIANRTEEDIPRQVRKTRFRKNFKFQLEGWADLRLAVVDLAAQQVLVNSAGKQIKATLENNAGLGGKSGKPRR